MPEDRLVIDSGMGEEEYGICNFNSGIWEYECTGEIIRRHPEWPAAIRQAIERRRIMQGMTKHQALAAWGWPLHIKIKELLFGKKEEWAYISQYLYFQNGKLVDWSEEDEEEKLEFYDIPEIQADPRSILIPEVFNQK